jgi:hypothetical protein
MLPKLEQPTFTLILPSTKKQIRYRSFTVKEEKLLLIAQASADREDYINVFKQLINNCCVDPIDVDTLASYDIEYFFLNLRSKSVSNMVKLTITDDNDKQFDIEVNLDDVKVHESTVSNKILLDKAKNIGIKLKYPTFTDIARLSRRDDGQVTLEEGLDLFVSLIDMIWEGDTVYPAKESTHEELKEWIEGFSNEQVKMVEDFLEDLPFVYLDIKYVDSNGEQKVKRITGIESFFA